MCYSQFELKKLELTKKIFDFTFMNYNEFKNVK